MQLHGFWRSLATYRVRIALNLKGVAVPETMVDLDAGDQHVPSFRAINPMGAVPALVLDDGTVLTQSLAILEWIEETHPTPPLLPDGAVVRARVRALCAITAADTHPLMVPRVQGYLGKTFGADDAARKAWAAHWFTLGLQAYEAQVGAGPFCAGDAPGMADCCLASHVAGAERFGADLQPFPAVRRIQGACMSLPAFANAHPLRQPGAPAA
jgi:maleylacetoacetate isomerase